MEKTDFIKLLKPDEQSYLNRVISNVNDHVVRISIMTAPYPWHYHPDSDETFIGIEGTVIIETRDELIELTPGTVVTIPKGVAHCTRPKDKHSRNLTVEYANLQTIYVDNNNH
ncbi:cupin domain-containing protein [Mucilaginibacter limnophilus]|uniref:Cupin domain-containing protein n=1 Tax=Mucilaginibacter limnophilus TaxID=1932778 RepID=A0A437MRR1_9SPHI|nr:cupin domain-containing protein [Mucilaginibacter limnophilus]RVU00304.1 cupin domain-containing protein [Mucilaginibacter limnophilus]